MKPFALNKKEWKKAVVRSRLDERSYEVETADGTSYRRNRAHLRMTKESPPNADIDDKLRTEQEDNGSPNKSTLKGSSTPGRMPSSNAEATTPLQLLAPCIADNQPLEIPSPKATRSGRILKEPAYLKDFER